MGVYKVQIVGGIFLALSFFEYFYRYQLKAKRKKQIKDIICRLERLKQLRAKLIMGTKKITSDDLEHQALEMKIDNVVIQMNVNNRILTTQIDTEFEVVNYRLNDIFSKFKKSDKEVADLKESTNKRLKIVEKDTDFIRAAKRWKYITGLALVGLITITNWEDLKILISKIKFW